ncbi:ArgS-related anticodon-binding protein NrtL [Streptomyces sp. XD-27]|uniref:ArgS-related anticodon-binding protein NrtL n=1 Tax=Streptomyces sp. XD-27 TaxID=3062779 RepID=UPI0026F422A9|nr:DALR anticodon-binding domain-containing protein [Streptomyces sp. XD-27]WKX72608.1 DALR anticodon-binding domain-containing protein [Streptomyces sp. XD-27]
MTPAQLSRTVLHAVRRAVEDGALRVPVPERVQVERARAGGCGDYASSVALKLARPAGLPPRAVAEILQDRVAGLPGIDRVEITGAGFLNFTVARAGHRELVQAVRSAGVRYGHGAALAGTRVSFAPADELRADLLTRTVVRLLRSQGAQADVAPQPEFSRSTPGIPQPAPKIPQSMPGISRSTSAIFQSAPAMSRSTSSPAHGSERLHVVPVPAGAGDLFARLGSDAARWALLRPAAHDVPVLDPGTLLAQREANPLFRIRYAHARTRALLRNARDLGFQPEATGASETGTSATDSPDTQSLPAPYADPREAELIALLADHPRVLEAAARHRAPDRLARHLEATADAFFRCHDACPPLPRGEQKPSAAHRARLALADAAGAVLAGGLSLLGISAPDIL